MDILGKSGLGLELAKQVAVVKVPGVLPFDGIGAAALAYLDQKKRAEAAEAEVERLKEVLGDGVRMAAAMNMTAGWVDSAKQILGGKS